MAKGYIVVDMPENCGDCKFRDIYDAPYCIGCTITRMTHAGWDKPDWCPILPQPEKFEAGKEMWNEFEDGVESGRNGLIEEMFGGDNADTKTAEDMR